MLSKSAVIAIGLHPLLDNAGRKAIMTALREGNLHTHHEELKSLHLWMSQGALAIKDGKIGSLPAKQVISLAHRIIIAVSSENLDTLKLRDAYQKELNLLGLG